MQSVVEQIQKKHLKKAVVDVKSGDTVRVHQKIVEAGKERIQVFEGLVIRAARKNSLTSSFTVRRIASGIGVEKTFLIHSPAILKVEVTKRSKVRRNYLTYMRGLTGKSARLSSIDFDKQGVNEIDDKEAEAAAAEIHEKQLESYDPEAAKAEKAELEAETASAQAEPDESTKLEEKPKLRPSAENPAEPQNKESK